jgi:hypothetical protein
VNSIAWALVAHGLLAASLFVSDGLDQPVAETFLLLACGAASAALFVKRPSHASAPAPLGIAFSIAMVSAVAAFVRPPGIYLDQPLLFYRAMSAVVVGVVASYGLELRRGAQPMPAGRLRPYAMLALAFALGGWMIHAAPNPRIDVWPVHQQGARALWSGHSPYAQGVIDTPDTGVKGRMVRDYGYPPMNAILTTAAYGLTGETRWAALAAIVVGGYLLWRFARRQGGGDLWSGLLLACWLFHPRALFVIEAAWGDPLVLPFLCGFALAVATRRFRSAAVLLGLACSVKQHFALYVPVLAAVPGIGLSGTLIALGVAAATCLPFAVVTPRGLWGGLVTFHLAKAFRPDSLSLSALIADAGLVLPSWVGFAATFAFLLAASRLRRSLGYRLVVSAAAFLVFYLLGRQAFCNYYYIVGATLLLGAGGLVGEREA